MGYVNSRGDYVKGTYKPEGNEMSSQAKAYSHMMQRKVFGADIVQPHVNGQPNREFIEVYRGEVADKYFTREQIDKADRQLGGVE
jgi:hypothetical protein